jgi:hypothetical protein
MGRSSTRGSGAVAGNGPDTGAGGALASGAGDRSTATVGRSRSTGAGGGSAAGCGGAGSIGAGAPRVADPGLVAKKMMAIAAAPSARIPTAATRAGRRIVTAGRSAGSPA